MNEADKKDIDRLNRIFSLLKEMASIKEIKRWMHEPIEEWNYESPASELERGNTVGVLNLVERIYNGECGF